MIEFERDEFIKTFGVPRGTSEKLDRYAALLSEWNQKFNLVSEGSLEHVWNRHFLDSAQIIKYLPNDPVCIADLGSGAGFPGLVLSIMTPHEIHLVESTGKKAGFLREVIADLKLTATVHNDRIEKLKDLHPDVVTARALGSVLDLLNIAKSMINKDNMCIFLKGQKCDAELTESAKYWTFTQQKHKSISDPSGSVLILKDIRQKYVAPRNAKFKRRN